MVELLQQFNPIASQGFESAPKGFQEVSPRYTGVEADLEVAQDAPAVDPTLTPQIP